MKRLIIVTVIGAVTIDLTWVAVMWWLERPEVHPWRGATTLRR